MSRGRRVKEDWTVNIPNINPWKRASLRRRYDSYVDYLAAESMNRTNLVIHKRLERSGYNSGLSKWDFYTPREITYMWKTYISGARGSRAKRARIAEFNAMKKWEQKTHSITYWIDKYWGSLRPRTKVLFVFLKTKAAGIRKLKEREFEVIVNYWELFNKNQQRFIHRAIDRTKIEGKAKSIYFEKIGKQLPKKLKSVPPSKKPSGTVSKTPSAPASKTASGKPSKKHVHPRTGKSPTQTRKNQKPSPYVIHPPPPLHLPTYKK